MRWQEVRGKRVEIKSNKHPWLVIKQGHCDYTVNTADPTASMLIYQLLSFHHNFFLIISIFHKTCHYLFFPTYLLSRKFGSERFETSCPILKQRKICEDKCSLCNVLFLFHFEPLKFQQNKQEMENIKNQHKKYTWFT